MYAKFHALYEGASATLHSSVPGTVTMSFSCRNFRSSASCFVAASTNVPGAFLAFALLLHSTSETPGAYLSHSAFTAARLRSRSAFAMRSSSARSMSTPSVCLSINLNLSAPSAKLFVAEASCCPSQASKSRIAFPAAEFASLKSFCDCSSLTGSKTLTTSFSKNSARPPMVCRPILMWFIASGSRKLPLICSRAAGTLRAYAV